MPVISSQVIYYPYSYLFDDVVSGPGFFVDETNSKIYYANFEVDSGSGEDVASDFDFAGSTKVDYRAYDGVNTFGAAEPTSFTNLHLHLARFEEFYFDTLPGPTGNAIVEIVGGGDAGALPASLTGEGFQTYSQALYGEFGENYTTLIPAEWAAQQMFSAEDGLEKLLVDYKDAVGSDAAAAGAAFASGFATAMQDMPTDTGLQAVEIGMVFVIDTGVAIDQAAPDTAFENEIIVTGATNHMRVVTYFDTSEVPGTLIDVSGQTPVLDLGAGETISDLRLLEYGPKLDAATLADVEAATRSLSDANGAKGLDDIIFINLESYLDAFGILADGTREVLPIDASRHNKFISFEDRGYSIDMLPTLQFSGPVDITVNLDPSVDHYADWDSFLPEGSRLYLHNGTEQTVTLDDVTVDFGTDLSADADVIISYLYIYGGDDNDDISLPDVTYLNSTIYAGAGNDTFYAGNGYDQFVIDGRLEGDDKIVGFDHTHDELVFYYYDSVADANRTVYYSYGDGDLYKFDDNGTVDNFIDDIVFFSLEEEIDDLGNLTVNYSYDNFSTTASVELGGGAPLYIDATGERWGNYIKYGVYASDDITTADMNVTLSWLDSDYSMVAGSAQFGAVLDTAGGNINEDHKLSPTDTSSNSTFNFATPSANPISVTKGDLLYEFLLLRETDEAKEDDLTLSDVSFGADSVYRSDDVFSFNFDKDNVDIDYVTRSGEAAPNAKLFHSNGSVMDGLIVIPKATLTLPDTVTESGTQVITEYDIELRVSFPQLDLGLPLASEYVMAVDGAIDFGRVIADMDTSLTDAGFTDTALKFYQVSKSDMTDTDGNGTITWAEVQADSGATVDVVEFDKGGSAAWDEFGEGQDLDGADLLFVSISTSGMKDVDGNYTVGEGSYKLGSFMSISSGDDVHQVGGFDYLIDGNNTHFAAYYEDIDAADDLGALGSSGNTLVYENLPDNSYSRDATVSDGSEVYLTSDIHYQNPIGAGIEAAITAYDATLALDIAAAVGGNRSNAELIAADFDRDRDVDNVDAQLILKYAAHIESFVDGGITKAVPKAAWHMIDNVDGNGPPAGLLAGTQFNENIFMSAVNDIKFDHTVDYFVGQDRYIDATAVLVGDVSANYVYIPDDDNPMYDDFIASEGAAAANTTITATDGTTDTISLTSTSTITNIIGFKTTEDKINVDNILSGADVVAATDIAAGGTEADFIDDEVYVFADGGTATTGGTAGDVITDYTNLTQVAAFLSDVFTTGTVTTSNDTVNGDNAIFVVNDLIGEKTHVYKFVENGTAIDADAEDVVSGTELTIVAVITETESAAIVAADFF